MSPSGATVLDVLRTNAERHPEKLLYAFLDKNGRTTESYTYESFLRRTREIASLIHGTHQLAPGQRVLLVYPPGLEMICALFACARLGLIPVPVYPPASHGFAAALYRMDFIAKDCGAAAALTDRTYFWSLKLHRARASLSSPTADRGYTARLPWIATDAGKGSGGGDVPEASSEILFLQYTSGSTNDPKGVMVTHANVMANCHAVVDHLPVTVSWLPQYHDMGLIAFYFFVAISGGSNYGASPIDFIQRPLSWLEAIGLHRATASAAPNFAYEYCLRPGKIEDADLEGVDLGSLRILLNGAEPVKASVFRDFLARFGPYGLKEDTFSTAYGLAEYTLAVTGRGRAIRMLDAERLHDNEARAAAPPSEAGRSKALVSCGKPLGPTEVRIVDIEGAPREAAEGRVGEVWISGPSKCLGYWGRRELSDEVFRARLPDDSDPDRSWLRTGDLGFVQDRELFVCGRAKDVIIIRGANHYPQDIEAIVEESPSVRRGCVAAFQAADDGHDVVVVAELKKRTPRPDTERINREIRRRLGISVDLFVFIPKRTIPKTSSGKISRHRAHSQWREGSLSVIDRVEVKEPSLNATPSLHQAETHGEGLSWETRLERLFLRYGLTRRDNGTLTEAGLDSLAMVDFSLDLEKHVEARGASDLADEIDVRWLQRMPVSELFELVGQLSEAASHSKLRFRRAMAALRRGHVEDEAHMMRRDVELAITRPSPSRPFPDVPASSGGILLTGGTGFFGPFLLRSLLEQTEDRIHVLVRAQGAEDGRQRLESGLAGLQAPLGEIEIENWRERIIPVCGDLARPSLGLDPSEWSQLSGQIHTVYHNGALVNYLLDYGSMRDTNVGSTNELIRLAWASRPKVFNHISTTFVFGWSSKEILFESDTNPDMELLDFGYSQSKWVSEQLVLEAMQRGLTGRVFRPALIAPSTSGGGDNFDIAIRLLAFMLNHGITATAQNQVSLSPADVAANNIVAISRLPDTVGRTFHVTRDEYASLLDVTDIFGKLTETEFAQLSVEAFVPTMIERCRKGDLLFPLVNFFAHSVDNITAMEFKRYDSLNYRTARDRTPFGIADPPLEDVVLGILRFMARHRVIGGRKAELVLAARRP